MKKLFILTLVVLFVFSAVSAFAQNNNPCPGDKEYQFNIIGMKNAKNPAMDNNDGHRIFVPLKGNTSIYMTGDTDPSTEGLQCGKEFNVLDANGTDGRATILVPCDPLTADNLNPSVCFDVWATPLGTPGGHTDVQVVCDFTNVLNVDVAGGDCGTGTIGFTLAGHNKKPVSQDITKYFRASGCIDVNVSGVCDAGDINFNNEWIFNIPELESYYWDYDNDGNRIVQIRFCNVEGVPGSDCGPNTIVQ